MVTSYFRVDVRGHISCVFCIVITEMRLQQVYRALMSHWGE